MILFILVLLILGYMAFMRGAAVSFAVGVLIAFGFAEFVAPHVHFLTH